MKPAFALSLSVEGIELLHRSDSGWQPVGTVQVDDPDLKGAMRGLRDRALALADDTRCEVIIPNDQIRCIAIETGALTEDEWRKTVEAELAVATPYSLSELAFDTLRKLALSGPVDGEPIAGHQCQTEGGDELGEE